MAELILGYAGHLSTSKKFPTILATIQSISKQQKQLKLAKDSQNPLIRLNPLRGYKAHTYIDFTGFHKRYKREETKLDYFGFRNDEEMVYFRPRTKNTKLIVFTGGSETGGFAHENQISDYLKKILNKHTKHTYEVINLGMNSYSLANEINSYVHLVYHLKPDIVISHTGFNDFHFARGVPIAFRQLGLNYWNMLIRWYGRLYQGVEPAYRKLGINPNRIKVPLDDPEARKQLIAGFLGTMQKYRNIVEANGGRFVPSLQPLNIPYCKIKKGDCRHVVNVYRDLMQMKAYQQFVDHSDERNFDLLHSDPVHTNEKGAIQTALRIAKKLGYVPARGKLKPLTR